MNLDLESLGLRWRQMRFNPLRSLTPERLASALDQFEAGWLREASLIFETIEKREFMIGSVMRKRRAAVARRDWQIIVPDENDPRAEAHKATLEHFYNNLTVTDATDLNVRTGMSGLVRQMMNAELQKYAVHEIVWQPGPDGLTAELRHVPLYFFENRTGKLKFVGVENRADGIPLEEGGWMTTVGSGLGEALSILYMFKRLGVQDLIAFSEKFSVPGVLGRTSAPKDSDAGKAMRDSVLSYAADWIGITYNDDGAIKSPIEIMQTPSSGTLPQMSIIEYMDRGMAVLVRGGDLSTISRGDGTGSNPQQDELDALLQDDCAMISETLQTQLDRLVIRMVHGDEKPAAYIVINPPSDEDLARELTIDTGLFGLGVKQDPADLAERYGREMAKPVGSDPSEVIPLHQGNEGQVSGNEKLAAQAGELTDLQDLLRESYADVAAVIDQALNAEGSERVRLLEEAAAMLPDQVGDDALDDAITEMLARAFLGDEAATAENYRQDQLRNLFGEWMPEGGAGGGGGGNWNSYGLLPAAKIKPEPSYEKVPAYVATARLIKGETVMDDRGTPVLFDGKLIDHWIGKPTQELRKRLGELDDAQHAVRNPQEVWMQGSVTAYLRKYSGHGPVRWMAVFVQNKSGKTYYSSERINKADNSFRKGTLLRKR